MPSDNEILAYVKLNKGLVDSFNISQHFGISAAEAVITVSRLIAEGRLEEYSE